MRAKAEKLHPFEIIVHTHSERMVSITISGPDVEDAITFPADQLDWMIETLTKARASLAN